MQSIEFGMYKLLHKASSFAISLIAAQVIILPTTTNLYAQQVYKSVDKQGRVTYSEVPPLPSAGGKVVDDGTGNASGALPYALAQIVSRYPVTLYTNTDCAPCINARIMLTQRGVPFTEKSVNSNEDVATYKRLNAEASIPMVTIAAQQLKGYEEGEWTKYLDAAGYPKTSTLPRSYNQAAATPLAPTTPVTPKKVADKATDNAAGAPAKPAATNSNNPNNPAGIKF